MDILLRTMIRNFYDFQDMRIRYSGRLKIKADGTPTASSSKSAMSNEALETFEKDYDLVRETEDKLRRDLEKYVKKLPEWKYLETVKGIGPILAGVLISEIDITKAETVSAIWQYAGLNPHYTIHGRKYENGKIVETDEMVRGDRKTKGYLCPYNQFLKEKLLGVMSGCLIQHNPMYKEMYENYKLRLETSTKLIKDTEIMWKDTAPAHRDRAARRFIIQMFLVDYYKNVRTLYNLPVRDTYAEEKMGKVHHSK